MDTATEATFETMDVHLYTTMAAPEHTTREPHDYLAMDMDRLPPSRPDDRMRKRNHRAMTEGSHDHQNDNNDDARSACSRSSSRSSRSSHSGSHVSRGSPQNKRKKTLERLQAPLHVGDDDATVVDAPDKDNDEDSAIEEARDRDYERGKKIARERYGNEKVYLDDGDIDPEDEHREKQAVLLELMRLQQTGVRLTREFSLEDSLDSMQFEARRHHLHAEEQQTTTMLKDGMCIAFTGIEYCSKSFFNHKILNLEGWASATQNDINTKWDQYLRRIYRKYWSRACVSPEAGLAMCIGSSMLMHHMKGTAIGMGLNAMGMGMGMGSRTGPGSGSGSASAHTTPGASSSAAASSSSSGNATAARHAGGGGGGSLRGMPRSRKKPVEIRPTLRIPDLESDDDDAQEGLPVVY